MFLPAQADDLNPTRVPADKERVSAPQRQPACQAKGARALASVSSIHLCSGGRGLDPLDPHFWILAEIFSTHPRQKEAHLLAP